MNLKNTFIVFFLLISCALNTKAQVTANFTVNKSSGCPDLVVIFTNTSTGATSYLWKFGDGGANSAVTNPQRTFSNPGVYTVTLIATGGGFTDSIKTNITVFKVPESNFGVSGSQTGCSPLTVNFQNQTVLGDAPITSYNWIFGDGPSSTEESPTHTYTDVGSFAVSLEVVDANGCEDINVEAGFITVNPSPDVDFSTPDATGSCTPPITVNFVSNASGSGTLNYSWTLGNGTSSTVANPSATYNSVGTYNVSLQVTDQTGCSTTVTENAFVTIGSSTNASFTASKTTVCPWELIQFTDNSTGATDYSWDFGDGTSSLLQNPSHFYSTGGTYTVTLTASINGACTDQFTTTITVNSVEAAFSSDPNVACETPLTVNYTNLSTNASSYQWVFGNGNTSTLINPSNTINATGTFTDMLIATSASGCKDTANVVDNITIFQMTPDIRMDVIQGCIPLTISFADSSSSPLPITDWSWDFGDGNTSTAQHPTNTFDDAQKYFVTLTITNNMGCIATITDSVRAGTKPVADFSRDPQIACAESPVLFFDNSTDANLVNEWIWDFGDGASSLEQDPVHLYQDTGNFSITLQVAYNGCFDTITKDTNVIVLGPVATFIPFFDCATPYDYTFISTIVDATNTYWDFGDGSPLDSINPDTVYHTYAATGDYIVILTTYNSNNTDGVKDTCFYIYQYLVRVRDIGSAFTMSKQIACAAESVTFDGSTSVDEELAFGYEWNFGDSTGNITVGSAITTHAFSNAGTYQVRLVVTDLANCKDTSYQTIRIFQPEADFVADTLYGCTPLTVNFSDQTTADTTLVSWNWTFGNGTTSTLQNPSTVYPQRGYQNVTLIVTDEMGCTDTETKLSYIYPMKPIPNFTSSKQRCINQNTVFTNQSIGDDLTYNWAFSDGFDTTLTHPIHAFADTGLFSITLTAMDSVGCDSTRTFSNYVHVQGLPIANFSSDKTELDCYPKSIAFSDSSVSPYITSWVWQFFDGQANSTQQNPSHTYLAPGSYDVTLTVTTTYGCVGDTTKEDFIKVNGPTAAFDVFPDTICLGNSVTFAVTEYSSVGMFIWDFNDGIADTVYSPDPLSHLYGLTGTYLPRLTLVDSINANCRINIVDTVDIHDATASFTQNVSVGCPPLAVTFTNNSDAGTYLWIFGNGGSSTASNPVHNFTNSGTIDSLYNVALVVTTPFGCKDTSYTQIRVYPGANPNFTSSADSGCVSYSVNFTNIANNQASYTWDFGNGHTSTTQNPSQTYINSSDSVEEYFVQLTTVTADGCMDSSSQTLTVFPKPDFVITSLPDSGCSPLLVNFSAVTGSSSSKWDFGDGSTSLTSAPAHTYLNSSGSNIIRTVQFIGTSQYGCQDTTYSDVNVFYNPIAQFNLGTAPTCTPASIAITNTSSGGSLHHWVHGDGTSLDTTALSHTHIFTNPNTNPLTYNVTLITENIHGCTDSLTKPITIAPSVIADFTVDTLICSGDLVTFQNTSIGACALPTCFSWSFGNGIFFPSIAPNPANLFASSLNDTIYNITLIATSKDNSSCKDTTTKQIRIKYTPDADFTTTVSAGCTPVDLGIQNASQGATTYNWSYGDGSFSDTSVINQNHIYTNPGTGTLNYEIELIATSAEGCTDTIKKNIAVYEEVTANFSPINEGCSPVSGTFVSSSTNGASLAWNFNNGNTSSSATPPAQTFTNPGASDLTFNISLIADINGCKDTAIQSLIVFAQPQATFSATPASQVYPNATVSITNSSSFNPLWQFSWDFDDGQAASGQNPGDHTYATWGDYMIDLTITTGNCSASISQLVKIIPPPAIASFTPVPAEGCEPLEVSFNSTSDYATSWLWNFEDGTTSTEESPTHLYQNGGLYGVTLTVTGPDGGSSTISFDNVITVYDRAVPKFSYTPEKFLIPSDRGVVFTNESSFASSYLWVFGDGDSSTLVNPEHFYEDLGQFDVLLIANNTRGCIDSVLVTNAILVKERGILDFPNAFTPNNYGSNGGVFDINDINNEVFFPKYQAIVDYHLMIFNRWGELIFETFDVNQGWDGYYRGKLCQQDVYVWKVEVTFEDEPDKPFVKAGDLTLLR